MMRHSGDSSEQQSAEGWLLQRMSQGLEVRLREHRIQQDSGRYPELDGFCESPPYLCEIWAHVGPPKPAQKYKVMKDTLKFLCARQHLGGNARCILIFGDAEAAAHFQGASWMAECLTDLGIEVHVMQMPPGLTEQVSEAQEREKR